jgi:cysteine desulfurase
MSGAVQAPVYLDHAATTPVDPRVAVAMAECLTEEGVFGNPASATHAYGREAAAALESARADVAALVGTEPEAVIFTSGATEADNLAIFGVAAASGAPGCHIVTQATEHKAVLDACLRLRRRGVEVTVLPTDSDGCVSSDRLAGALRPETRLVSIMHANNETGVLQDIARLAAVCRDRGVLLHADAAQSAGRLPVDLHALGVDLLSLSAHKLYGPKGVGALVVSTRARPCLEPQLAGGGQERGLRPGTVAVHQAVGFAAAVRLVRAGRDAESARLGLLGDRLAAALQALGGVRINGAGAPRLPGFVSASFDGVEGESLVAGLAELAVASGAACDSATGEPSHVLRALGVSPERAQATLRLTLGRGTTAADVECAIAAVSREVQRLRAIAP